MYTDNQAREKLRLMQQARYMTVLKLYHLEPQSQTSGKDRLLTAPARLKAQFPPGGFITQTELK